ncbi:MAG TPA: hypothetical protein VGB13_00775 [Candidatus Krumholzibacteria bacterium]
MRCARCSKTVQPSTGLLVVNQDDPAESFHLCQRDTFVILGEMTKDLTCMISAMRDAVSA